MDFFPFFYGNFKGKWESQLNYPFDSVSYLFHCWKGKIINENNPLILNM